MSDQQNILVITDQDDATVPMITFQGVKLPARVWRETAVALQHLSEKRIDDVLIFQQGSRIKVKPLTITKRPIR